MYKIHSDFTNYNSREYYWLPRCWQPKGEHIGQQCDVENESKLFTVTADVAK